MMMSLSGSRWICVVTLAVVMLSSASQVDSVFMSKPCCLPQPMREPGGEVQCWKHKGGKGCEPIFMIRVDGGDPKCVKPTPPWLSRRLDSGDLQCARAIVRRQKFYLDVLDEDDVDE